MNPRYNNRSQPETPETEVQIPHEEKEAPPITAPPLPIVDQPPVEPVMRPMPPPANLSAQRPVAPPPVRPEEFYEEEEKEPRRWLTITLYIVLAFLVAAAVVFAGRWIYNKVTDNEQKPSPPASGNQGQTPPPPAIEQPAPAQPVTPSAGGTANLPNNGPGDVMALFVGVTLAVAGLHYIYTLRRSS